MTRQDTTNLKKKKIKTTVNTDLKLAYTSILHIKLAQFTIRYFQTRSKRRKRKKKKATKRLIKRAL